MVVSHNKRSGLQICAHGNNASNNNNSFTTLFVPSLAWRPNTKFALVLFKTKKFYMSGSDVKIADRTLFIVGVLFFHEKD